MVSVTQVEKKLESFRELANLVNAREKIFDLRRTTKFAKDIAQSSKNFEPYSQMWNMIHSFQRNVTNWMHGAFAEIDGEKVEADVLNWHNLIGKLTRTMKGSTAPTAAINDFKTRVIFFFLTY